MNSYLLLSLFLLLSIVSVEHLASGDHESDELFRSRRAVLLDNGNFVVVDGFVNVVNGKVISGKGCYYHNGKVTDYGKTRAMTSGERAKLKQYMADMHNASAKFAQAMQRMFEAPFPFGPPAAPPPQLHLPQVPCFCSSSSCAKVSENSNGME